MDSTATILIVDDTEAQRYALGRALVSAGFHVREAADGGQALEMARALPDLILLDVKLPGIDGFEVCRRIKADPQTAHIPVIQTSAHFTLGKDRVHGLEGGADDYIIQPISPQELVAKLNAWVRVQRAEAALRAANAKLEARVTERTDELRRLQQSAARGEFDTPARARPASTRYAIAVAAVLAATLISLWLAPHSYATPFLPFYPAVVLAAWLGGFWPGILATFLSALVANYLMLPPHNTFNLDAVSVLQTVFFAVTFASLCWFADLARQRLHSVIDVQSQLLEMSFDPVLVRDAEDRIIYWNQGAERLYGWTKDEARGRVSHDLLRTVHPRPLDQIRTELSQNGRWHGELVHTRKDGSTVSVDSWWTLQKQGNRQSAILESNYDLTERKRAEESLRYVSAIVESSDAAIIGKTLDGIITSWNSGAERLYGYSAAEMIGQPISRLNPTGHTNEFPTILKRLAHGERIESYDTIRQHRDGTVIDVALKVSPIFDAAGKIIGASSIARDIRKRKRAERKVEELNQALQQRNAELEAERARWKGVVEGIADEVWVCDAQGSISLLNLPHVTHMELAEFKDKSIQQVLDEVDIMYPDGQLRPPEQAPLLRSLRGEICRGEEIMRHRQTGRTRYRQFSSAPTRDAAGAITGAVAIVRDVTEHKRVEEALRRSEERLRVATMAADLGVWYWNPGTSYIEVSANWRNLFGLAPDAEVTFDTWRNALHPDDRERAVAELNAANEQQREFNTEYRVVRPDGTVRWIVDRGRGTYDENGRALSMAGVNVDVTERKRAQEALIKNEKLASVGRMAATIAHEINNPLAAAMNALYLISSDSNLPENSRGPLQLAEHELERVAHITKQTLGFYREAGNFTKVHLPEVIDGVLSLFAPKLRNKSLTVERRYRCLGSAFGVEGEIRQVVSNLIANSIDALPPNGTLHVRTSGPVRLNGERSMVRLTIGDTGAGISPSAAPRIFEPFFTTKASIGTGLGLWVTKELVTKHEGRIRVRSRVGQGTVFTIWLPSERRQSQRVGSAGAA